MYQLSVIAIVYFLAGLIDAICGGGGLLTVPAMLLLGIPVHNITGTNQCSALFGGFTATYAYLKKGKIHIKSSLIAGIAAFFTSALGARLNLLIPPDFLKPLMIFLMPVVLIFLLLNKNFGTQDHSAELTDRQFVIRSLMIGLIIGCYQGFYGPGAGMFYTIAFCVIIKLDLLKGSGTARMAGFIASISATLTYATSGVILWRIAIIATLFNTVGNYIGSRAAIENGQKIIQPVLIITVVLMFVRLSLNALGIL